MDFETAEGLAEYLIPLKTKTLLYSTGSNLGDCLYSQLLTQAWCVAAVDYLIATDKEIDLTTTSYISDIPQPSNSLWIEPVGIILLCNQNRLTLQNIHKEFDQSPLCFCLNGNPIESNMLGLLKIKKLPRINLAGLSGDLLKASWIINKYLPEGDILDCQEELIEAGLDNFAQL